MAQMKSIEELLDEIESLSSELEKVRAQLAEKGAENLGAVAIAKLAEKWEVPFTNEKNHGKLKEPKTVEDYVNWLNKIYDKVIEFYQQKIKQVNEDAIKLIGDNESKFNGRIQQLEGELDESKKRVGELEAKVVEQEQYIGEREEALRTAQGNEITLGATNAAFEKRVAAQEKIIKELNEKIEELEKAKTTVVTVAEPKVEIKPPIDPDTLYSVVYNKAIVSVLKKQGYDKAAEFSKNGDTKAAKERGKQLYNIIRTAMALDKKSSKNGKEAVEYNEKGYVQMLAAMSDAYAEIKATYNEESIKEFERTYASDESKKDEDIKAEEIIKDIIDREMISPIENFTQFVKSKIGATLTSVAALVLISAFVVGGVFIGQNKQKESIIDNNNIVINELGETNDTLQTENEGLASDNAQKDEIIAGLEGEKQEMQNTIDQLQQGNGVNGEIVTLDVSSQEFTDDYNLIKTEIDPAGYKLQGVISCQYNKNTGEVDLLLSCLDRKNKPYIVHTTFTMDMSKMAPTIEEGTAVLSFKSIINSMSNCPVVKQEAYQETVVKETGANITMSSTVQTEADVPAILINSKIDLKGDETTISYTALVVTRNDKGEIIDVTPVSVSESYYGKINLEEKKTFVKESLYKQLGIETESELGLE